MAIANVLSAEPGVVCVHEGKVRSGEISGKQLLSFLTLENRLAYENPAHASELFRNTRANLPAIARSTGCTHFGDIAYNYAPFVRQIQESYPSAKLIVFFRNGVDFVRSAAQESGEDFTPVGWPPREKTLSAVERYVGLGRLSPRQSDSLADRWEEIDYVGRNAWLWAETNRIILSGIAAREAGSTYIFRYEDFFQDPLLNYRNLRRFLQLRGDDPDPDALRLLRTPINRRERRHLGTFESWTDQQRQAFLEFAKPMMDELGYSLS